jgi:hypothetical protein
LGYKIQMKVWCIIINYWKINDFIIILSVCWIFTLVLLIFESKELFSYIVLAITILATIAFLITKKENCSKFEHLLTEFRRLHQRDDQLRKILHEMIKRITFRMNRINIEYFFDFTGFQKH